MRLHALVLSSSLVVAFALPVRADTLFVGVTGSDAAPCGAKSPCRSISRALALAAEGDRIVVGPGRYGDLDGDGVLGEAGEETPTPGCGCMLAVNKPVSLTSSHGSAATVIDARGVDVATNVLLLMTEGEVGRPGKGFTITPTARSACTALAIDSVNIDVRGNQIAKDAASPTGGGSGIRTVPFPEPMVIEGNQVTGFTIGMQIEGTGKVVRRNQVALNEVGIAADHGTIDGNVVTANVRGIDSAGSARIVNNTLYGNTELALFISAGFTGVIAGNNIAGSDSICDLYNNGVPTLVAAGNWWGAATGPAPGRVCNGIGVTTTFAPFATKPFKTKAPIKPGT